MIKLIILNSIIELQDMMYDYFFKIYKDKKVLITGHNGFKGSWLSLWLQKIEQKFMEYH